MKKRELGYKVQGVTTANLTFNIIHTLPPMVTWAGVMADELSWSQSKSQMCYFHDRMKNLYMIGCL